MLLRFLVLVFYSLTIFGEEQKRHNIPDFPIPFTESMPSTTVNGCVDSISGIYFDHETDLVVPGPEPITVERYYASVMPRGWGDNVSTWFQLEGREYDKKKGFYKSVYTKYFEPTGQVVECYGLTSKKREPWCLQVDFNKTKGITNCGRGEISGQTNVKNISIHYHSDPKVNDAYTVDGSGEERIFKEDIKSREYYISKLKRPNGNKLEYTRCQFQTDLVSKVSASSDTNVPFGFVEYHHQPEKQFKKTLSLDISSNDKRNVNYKYFVLKHKNNQLLYLKSVQRPNSPNVTYDYKIIENLYALVSLKRGEEGRFIGINYYPPQKSNSKINYRVESLTSPVGVDDKPIQTHRFTYHINKDESGSTTVKDLANVITRYDYSNEQRLTSIHKSFNNKPHTTQNFYWHTKGQHQGNIASITLEDGNKKCIYVHGYQYDNAGNVLKEVLKGNLTSANSELPCVQSDGNPVQNKCETYTLTKTYNKKNCLLSVTEGDGSEITYTYDPKTNQVSAKFLWEHGLIRMREFFYYDQNAVLIKSILDDGKSQNADDLSGISERHITYITPKSQMPCVGFPEIFREMYLDLITGTEKLLSKSVNAYSTEGYLIRQEIFDSNDQFQYALIKEYDDMGNPTLETDALGQTITRKYDRNGNCIFEHGPRHDLSKHYTYDLMNRLIKEEEISGDERLVTSHLYNTLNQKTCSYNSFGHATQYSYDPFGNLIQVIMPPVADENGNLVNPTKKFTYNEQGQCTHIYDAKGHATQTSYTILDKPYLIRYPDGTTESHLYSTNGLLLQTTTRTGLIIKYSYDYLKRPTRQETYSSDGNLLTTETNHYNAFHLIASVDPLGHTTQYHYDSAGRQIAIEKEDNLTDFEYDALGRVSNKKEWYSKEEYTKTNYNYDLLNRIIETTLSNTTGTILRKMSFSYDVDGNQTQQIEWSQNGLAITTTEYNPYKQPIKIIDPQGQITYIQHNYHAKNNLNQNVHQKIITDPLGHKTIITYDTQGRSALVQKQNAFGLQIAKQETFYDLLGNISRVIDTVLPKEQEITTLYEYDAANRLVALTEACGTFEQKSTHYSYNKFGQKESTTKSDGTLILYTYDVLGRLEHFFSQDSFDYLYSYDSNNNLLSVTDQILQQITQRFYDQNDRMIKEILGNGITLQYSYDRQGRPLNVVLPDQSLISYRYDATDLREVQYENHCHRYLEYDLTGNMTEAELCDGLGLLNRQYDLMHRPTALTNIFWSQNSITYDPVGNLTEVHTQATSGDRVKNSYSYDDWYQVKAEHGAFHNHYTNDSLYNRIKKDGVEHNYNCLHQLLEQGQTKYLYDSNGNLFEQHKPNAEKIDYRYDALDRLISIQTPEETICYTYDAFNRRLSKQTSHSTVQFIYQDQNEIGSMENKKVTSLRILGKGLGAEIGAAILIELEGKTYVPIHDHRGNVASLIDPTTQAICESYRYNAFGEEVILDAYNNPQTYSKNPWRFSSKRIDPESSFVYFGRRYYDPTIGRWTTQDPLGFSAGPNLYAYLHNSPLTHFDLYGLYSAGIGSESIGGSSVKPGATSFYDRDKRPGATVSSRPVNNERWTSGSRFQITSTPRLGNQLFGSVVGQWLAPNMYRIGNETKENRHICYANGMGNDLSLAFSNTKSISDKAGGHKVHLFYSPTKGVVRDVLDYLKKAIFKTIPNNMSEVHQNWNDFFKKATPDAKILMYSHSRGTAETKVNLEHYPENLRKGIISCAIAPSVYIDKYLTNQTFHFCSKKDWITELDFWGRIRNIRSTYLLDPHPEAKYHDHPLQSKTYDAPIIDINDRYLSGEL